MGNRAASQIWDAMQNVRRAQDLVADVRARLGGIVAQTAWRAEAVASYHSSTDAFCTRLRGLEADLDDHASRLWRLYEDAAARAGS